MRLHYVLCVALLATGCATVIDEHKPAAGDWPELAVFVARTCDLHRMRDVPKDIIEHELAHCAAR